MLWAENGQQTIDVLKNNRQKHTHPPLTVSCGCSLSATLDLHGAPGPVLIIIRDNTANQNIHDKATKAPSSIPPFLSLFLSNNAAFFVQMSQCGGFICSAQREPLHTDNALALRDSERALRRGHVEPLHTVAVRQPPTHIAPNHISGQALSECTLFGKNRLTVNSATFKRGLCSFEKKENVTKSNILFSQQVIQILQSIITWIVATYRLYSLL